MLDTQTVMARLGVSRSWVNHHLRHIGRKVTFRDIGRFRPTVSVVYHERELLELLNSVAVFDRQTIEVPVPAFGLITEAEAKKQWAILKALPPSVAAAERVGLFFRENMPEDVYQRHMAEFNDRQRTNRWEPTQYHIRNMDELRSVPDILVAMNKPDSAPELAYRHIYVNGMIRARIFGRTYYIYPPALPPGVPGICIPASVALPYGCTII